MFVSKGLVIHHEQDRRVFGGCDGSLPHILPGCTFPDALIDDPDVSSKAVAVLQENCSTCPLPGSIVREVSAYNRESWELGRTGIPPLERTGLHDGLDVLIRRVRAP